MLMADGFGIGVFADFAIEPSATCRFRSSSSISSRISSLHASDAPSAVGVRAGARCQSCQDKLRPLKPSQPAEKNGTALREPVLSIPGNVPDVHPRKRPADKAWQRFAAASPSAHRTRAPHKKL